MSMSLTLVRIYPSGHIKRLVAIGVTIFFAVCYVATVVGIIFGCHRRPEPFLPDCVYPSSSPDNLGKNLNFISEHLVKRHLSISFNNVIFIPVDFVSDILLTALPLYFLWDVDLSPNDRRMVLAAFSASLLTLLSVIVCLIFVLSLPKSRPSGPSLIVISMLNHLAVCSTGLSSYTAFSYLLIMLSRPQLG